MYAPETLIAIHQVSLEAAAGCRLTPEAKPYYKNRLYLMLSTRILGFALSHLCSGLARLRKKYRAEGNTIVAQEGNQGITLRDLFQKELGFSASEASVDHLNVHALGELEHNPGHLTTCIWCDYMDVITLEFLLDRNVYVLIEEVHCHLYMHCFAVPTDALDSRFRCLVMCMQVRAFSDLICSIRSTTHSGKPGCATCS